MPEILSYTSLFNSVPPAVRLQYRSVWVFRVSGALGLQDVRIRGHYLEPKEVCRIMAFLRFWAIILPTFGGLGGVLSKSLFAQTLEVSSLMQARAALAKRRGNLDAPSASGAPHRTLIGKASCDLLSLFDCHSGMRYQKKWEYHVHSLL